MSPSELCNQKIDWYTSSSLSPYVFEAIVNGEQIRLRLNDFPEEVLCTLIIRNTEIDIEQFPKNWTLPRHRKI